MQFELTISPFDMKDILLSLVGTTSKIDVLMVNGERIESCLAKEYNEVLGSMVFEINRQSAHLPISKIGSIEFDGFHKYKGLSSKIFTID